MTTATTTTSVDTLRRDQDVLLNELQTAGAKFKGAMVFCPFHDDRSPSGSVYQDSEGVWRYKCHAASCGYIGDVFDIRATIENRPLEDILRETSGKQTPREKKPVYASLTEAEAKLQGTIQARYLYTNPHTKKADLVVYRLQHSGKKTFRQLRSVHRGYVFEAPPKPWPLYNRSRIHTAEIVVVVEGEKCVHALHSLGIIATTSPCGAGKAKYADWTPLAGKKIILWPDNDAGGLQHMQDVAAELKKLNPKPLVYWLSPEDIYSHDGQPIPDKGDAADLLDMLPVEIEDRKTWVNSLLIYFVESLGSSRDVKNLVEDIISGKRRAIPWKWSKLSKGSKALLPGTVTVLCGDPGATKSFMLLEAMADWHEQGIPVAIFELEEDRKYHLHRALAQRAGRSDILDDEWVAEHPDDARQILNEHQAFLDTFGRCIYETPDQEAMTLPKLARWVKERAEAGSRIIAIDPVTAASASETPWVEDAKFLMYVKKILVQHNASLILVTHPRTGRNKTIGMDGISGGAAYQRFPQTILWVERHQEPKSVMINGDTGGAYEDKINRTVHISKARNSFGHGKALGYQFHGYTMRMEEVGSIKQKK